MIKTYICSVRVENLFTVSTQFLESQVTYNPKHYTSALTLWCLFSEFECSPLNHEKIFIIIITIFIIIYWFIKHYQ